MKHRPNVDLTSGPRARAARRKEIKAATADRPVPMIQATPDFRLARYGEWLRGPRGNFLLMRTCEELVGGRWEGFVSIEDEDLGLAEVR